MATPKGKISKASWSKNPRLLEGNGAYASLAEQRNKNTMPQTQLGAVRKT